MPKPGRDLEVLVAAIERAVGQRGPYAVESPARLRDRITGELREIDVLVTSTAGRHTVRVGIECRDKNRKVDAPAVEAFRSKVQDLEIHKAIMVSSRGFTSPARMKASQAGIECLSLEAAEAFDWCLPRFVSDRRRDALAVRFELLGPPRSANPTYVRADGSPWTAELQNQLANELLRRHPLDMAAPDDVELSVDVAVAHPEDIFVIDDDGLRHRVRELKAHLSFIYRSQLSPIELHSYRSHEGGDVVYEVASARITGTLPGRLTIVRQPDGQLSFAFSAEDGAADAAPHEAFGSESP